MKLVHVVDLVLDTPTSGVHVSFSVGPTFMTLVMSTLPVVKSTYHRWQVPPCGAPVVSGGENAAGCNLPPTKLDLPPTIYL